MTIMLVRSLLRFLVDERVLDFPKFCFGKIRIGISVSSFPIFDSEKNFLTSLRKFMNEFQLFYMQGTKQKCLFFWSVVVIL